MSELVEILNKVYSYGVSRQKGKRESVINEAETAILSKYIRKDSLPSEEKILKVIVEHRTSSVKMSLAKAIKNLLEDTNE